MNFLRRLSWASFGQGTDKVITNPCPANMSRRGFLRAIGITTATVMLGGGLEIVEKKVIALTGGFHVPPFYYAELLRLAKLEGSFMTKVEPVQLVVFGYADSPHEIGVALKLNNFKDFCKQISKPSGRLAYFAAKARA